MKSKNTKIVFVRPISPLGYYARVNMQHPINLCLLGAIVKNAGFVPYIYDFEVESNDESKFIKFIIDREIDVVGFSCTTPQIKFADRLSGKIKRLMPDIKCVVGGAHISAIPKETFNEFLNFDVGFVGEADNSIVEYLKCLEKGEEFYNIAGIVFRRDNEIIFNQNPERIRDLGDVFPARDLLSMNKYMHLNKFKNVAAPGVYKPDIRATQLILSRGCIFNCLFCSNVSNFNERKNIPKIVVRNIQSIKEEILDCKYRFGINHFSVQDELFPANRDLLHEFCRIMEQEKLTFNCNSRTDILRLEDYYYMKRAGCLQIGFGVESGSERILRLINKRQTIDKIANAFDMAKRAGIRTVGYFLIGSHPDENEEDIIETIKFIKYIKPDLITCTLAVPYPGTQLRNILKEKGLIFSNDWDKYAYYSPEPVWRTFHFSSNDLLEQQYRVLRSLYLSPKYILQRLKVLASPSELLMLSEGGLRMIKFLYGRYRKKNMHK